jgi:hypothetical protein
MSTFVRFKNVEYLYIRVGAGTGAASKFSPGTGAATVYLYYAQENCAV